MLDDRLAFCAGDENVEIAYRFLASPVATRHDDPLDAGAALDVPAQRLSEIGRCGNPEAALSRPVLLQLAEDLGFQLRTEPRQGSQLVLARSLGQLLQRAHSEPFVDELNALR